MPKAKESCSTSISVKRNYLISEFIIVLLLILLSIVFPFLSQAQKSKDGVISYAPGSSTTVIANRYSALASSAAAGATSVTVANITDLSGATSFTNSTNAFATAALSPGDLVMIIQMQGASIATTDDTNYGNITAYNNTGNYELKTVLSISTNTITFCTALAKSYTVSGTKRCQVVRVPRFDNVTLGTNAILSAKPWDGTTGGVCAMEVNGNLSLSGKIDATGTGFRGATVANATVTYGSTGYRSTASTVGALKGEGIAGNQTDYASMNGQYGRGAPANGGGGGNNHNSGGGGGSNAGNNGVLTPWNGSGIKNTSTGTWATAWNLEALNFATDVSRGGGRGGYTYGDNDQNALVVGPGNSLWGGDSRRNVGGLGGRPLDYSSNTLLFMGGGGGAGDENDSYGGGGGIGGGIIYLLVSGTVSGSGTINANGNAGSNTIGGHNDAPGGGAGGGAVIVLSNSTITGVAINANGGNGGNQLITSAESEGPGGGGGGGYILTTTTSVTRTVNGGTNGTTSSSSLTEFLPNGATKGDAGTIATGSYAEVNSCFKELNGLNDPSCTPGTGSITASGTIINSYYAGTASASVGATRISVGTQRSGGATAKISPGDLLLVIQMQGSTINATNTSNYGAGAATYSGYTSTVAGTYEYVYAASGVNNGVVYLTTPLRKAYTVSAASGSAGQYSFQVVRVPEYASLNIAASASITVAEWNGSTGGIIAANVSGTMTLNGGTAITASSLGFRGGGGRQLGGGTGTNTDAVTLSSTNLNGSKGEGIAGTPKYTRSLANTLVDNGAEGYPNGSYAQGAPGNAGGGGTDGDPTYNDQNTGGGGGGNGGVGGRGGRAWNNPSQYGGYGGAVFSQAAANQLVLGGGGGAGTTNDGTGATGTAGFSSSGGSGGGMIFLKVNAVSGTGTIDASGAAGLSVDNDGGGGGGAGGSVYLYANNTAGLANVTINAKGGNGGNAWASQPDDGTPNNGNPEHGPGGGGGGGVIYTNGTINAASSVAGGAGGTTTTSAYNYGAAAGATGIKLTSATNPINIVKVFCDVDDDNDGITDVNENPSGVDPFLDADNDGVPNAYDATSGTVVAWADTNNDGVNDNYDSDKDGKINELDIDSDNDGITDNVEAQATNSYKIPSDVDTDGDGLCDLYELPGQIGTYGGNGLTPVDTDGDGIPDYLDTDSDNDGAPDRNEGDRNSPFSTVTQATIDASGDSDGDGLMDIFDNVNNDALTTNYYKNVTMSNMGALGDFNGPTPSGSYIGLQQSNPAADRDWRNASILPLQVVNLTVNYVAPIATLKWDVVNELQTNYYEVQVSTNGVDFNEVAKISAKNAGNTSYTYPHSINNQTANVFYYRIKQVDKDGKWFYTQIVVVRVAKAAQVSISPNPFVSFINITYTSDSKDRLMIAVIAADGKVVATKQVDVVKGTNALQLNTLGNLATGTYHVRLQSATGVETVTLLKQ